YRTLVLSLGWIGIALSLVVAAISIRKRLGYLGLGKMSLWLGAHVYLGLVAAAAIFLHSGFRTGGLLTASLFAVFSLTVASGLLGWWLSKKIPPLLTAIEESPAIMEDVILVRADCLRGMLELAAGGSAEFRVLV